MTEELDQMDGIGGRHGQARRLAEQAVRAQAAGDDDEADRLFAEAGRIDPDAVTAVLADRARDPEDTATGADADPQDDAEIAAMSRTIEPHSGSPSRSGIGGDSTGADKQGL